MSNVIVTPPGVEPFGPETREPILGTTGSSSSASLSFVQIGRILRRRKWIAICVFTAVMLTALLYITWATPLYLGEATVDISAENGGSGSLSDLIQDKLSGEDANIKMQTEMSIMQSQAVLTQVAKRLDMAHKKPFAEMLSKNPVPPGSTNFTHEQEAAIVGEMLNEAKFKLQPGTTIVQVDFLSPDPELARDVPNTIIDTYIGKDLGAGFEGTARVSEWLNSQIQELRNQVQEKQQKLTDFQRKEGIIGIDESQNMLVEKARLLNEELTSAEADRISKEGLYKVAQTNNPELIGAISPNPTLQVLRGQEIQLKIQYNEARSRYGDSYPTVRQQKEQLDALEATIDSEVAKARSHFELDYLGAVKSEAGLRANLDDQKKKVFALDQNAADFAILRHDAEATRNLYDAIQYKLKETGLLDTLKSTQFRLVDEAKMPTKPAAPRKVVILAGSALFGMFLAMGSALIVGIADDAVYSSDDLERFTGRPILGAIPHVQFSSSKNESPEDARISSSLILYKEPSSRGAEAFRVLRSSLLLSFVDRVPQVQVITSTGEAEGKSFISVNYALSLAQRGAKVLLVDADLRRGALHARMGIPQTPGVTNVLSSRNLVADIQAPFEDFPNLHVLPRGPIPPNPAELLDSKKMADVVNQWRTLYDYIIIDSAPLLPVADTFAVAAKADIVLLVVRVGVTHRRSLLRMLEMLKRVNATVGGLIINDVTRSLDEYSYYYGEYGYYSDKADKAKKKSL
jgi:capsular exopolysaccharide synthesis family protein